jgi:murein DD-endopeptidase MepM/ murein hydrolase activator NlpD
LAAPVTPYKLSSRFGKRRDPFTKRWAQHEGVDLSAPRRSPVLATAPGRVSFVGWKGAYGRMIEIDHGYGLKTRYGHLYRTYVKKGDQVIKQERIAVIGSSGRSTGRHLHYEVRFDGQPLDPKTFLKAGDHVFKDGQK